MLANLATTRLIADSSLQQIFGSESTGKSTLALHALASAQKRGGFVCLVDAENAFDKHYADVSSLLAWPLMFSHRP